MLVALNAGEKPETVSLNLKGVVPGDAVLKDPWTDEALPLSQGRLSLTLPALEGRVLIG